MYESGIDVVKTMSQFFIIEGKYRASFVSLFSLEGNNQMLHQRHPKHWIPFSKKKEFRNLPPAGQITDEIVTVVIYFE